MDENIIPNIGEKKARHSLWYTYFGKGGAAVAVFLWTLALLVWIIEVIRIG